jgi:hypothetical protein
MDTDYKAILKAIASNGAVWAGVVGLVNALQLWLFPDVPTSVMLALNMLVVAIGASLGVVVSTFRLGVVRGEIAAAQKASIPH